MGPEDPQDVARLIARDLPDAIRELARMKAEANHWCKGAEYATLRYRLEAAHAAAEAAMIEARRRVRNDQ